MSKLQTPVFQPARADSKVGDTVTVRGKLSEAESEPDGATHAQRVPLQQAERPLRPSMANSRD